MNKYLEWQQSDYYAILGVTRMAGTEAIRKAFRQRAKEYHPDHFSATSPERQDATDYFKQLILARDTLLDPVLREEYDKGQDLIQQAYFDTVIYDIPKPETPPPEKKSTHFSETLKKVYSQSRERDYYHQVNHTVGAREYMDNENFESDETDSPQPRGIPEHSKRSAATFYYARGMRLAARGEYRRALYAFNNAKMLDANYSLPEHIMLKIRRQAYYS